MKDTKTSTYKRFLPEVMIYIVAWGCILLYPIVYAFFRYLSGDITEIRWSGFWMMYLGISPFFLLFLLSNYCLIPHLLLRKKVVTYVLSSIFLAIVVFYFTSHVFPDPWIKGRVDKERWEKKEFAPFSEGTDARFRSDFDEPGPRERGISDKDGRPNKSGTRMNPAPPPRGEVPGGPFMDGPFIGHVFIALLMFGFNIAVKLFFKSVHDEEALKELEHHNVKSELNYLKYQINPHFFMNTLNNIHALVDIDSERAKQTLVELSHMMRYVLYETDQRLVPFVREMDFLSLYVKLMRIRYNNNVCIEFSVPQQQSGAILIPPLLFVSFIENAFKHGISYQKESFVSIKVEIEGQDILFHCQNSNHSRSSNKVQDNDHHGVGLENIKKRLQLLYNDRYTLTIQDLPERYDVLLVIPIN